MNSKTNQKQQEKLDELIEKGNTKKEALKKIIQRMEIKNSKINKMKTITLLLVLLVGLTTQAQWTTNLDANTLVANADNAQSISTSKGNTYIVFWNKVDAPTNYELRLQVIDKNGYTTLGENGVLVSDSIPMSSFTQVGFIQVDHHDNIYIGATGTLGNVGHLFKMNEQGEHLWSPKGKNIGTGYLVRTLPLSNGDIIISWLDGSYNGNIQKFNAQGEPLWENPVAIQYFVPANSFELSDGGHITIYHQLGSGISSHMHAQRYDAEGNPIWNAPLKLVDNNYRTVYNSEYSFAQDGDVIYVGYKLSHNNRFDSFVQRINPDGSLPWGLNGIDFDIKETNYEQETQIVTSENSNFIWALCRYSTQAQGESGIYTQQFDKNTGERLLGDDAKEVYPIHSSTAFPAGEFTLIQGQAMFLAVGDNGLEISALNKDGEFAWQEESKPLATYSSNIFDVNINTIADQELVVTFVEEKENGSQIFAQNFTDIALSIAEESTAHQISYTNPVSNALVVNTTEGIKQVSIYSLNGTQITKVDTEQKPSVTLNTSNWQKGIYLGWITTSNGEKTSIKIVKQ